MNSKIIFDSIVLQNLRLNFKRNLSLHQNFNRNSISYNILDYKYKNKEKRNINYIFNVSNKKYSHFSNKFSKHVLFQCLPLSTEIYAKKMSNDTLGVNDVQVVQETVSPFYYELAKNISESPLIGLAQDILLHIHNVTGLPWWASITLSAFFIRAGITLPLSITQMKVVAKLENIKYEMDDIVRKLKSETNYAVRNYDWPETFARQEYNKAVKTEWDRLVIRDNCHPLKTVFLVLIQVPAWVSMSFAIRNLCSMLPVQDTAAQLTYLELSLGGIAWFPNLIETDPYFILPIAMGIVNAAIIEVHRLFRVRKPSKYEKITTYVFRFSSIFIAFIASYLPAAVNLYWLSSSSYGLLQAFLLQSPKLKRITHIPITESELEHPYLYFKDRLKSNFQLVKK